MQAGRRIDWFRLAKHLAGNRRLAGAYVFDRAPGAEPGNPKRRFHDHLRYSGFRVLVRPTRPDARLQGEINVALAAQLMAGACHDRFDVAIVATSDPDLVPAIERVSEEGKIVEVAGVAGDLSQTLRLVADRMHHIDDLPVLEILPAFTAQEANEYMQLQESSKRPGQMVSLTESVDDDLEGHEAEEEEEQEVGAQAGSEMPFAREV